MIRSLIVAHAESPWMAKARRLASFAAWCSIWLGLGLSLGAVTDLVVRLVAA
jgi:hypothetical protein